jgi:hypothetical protein
MGARTTPTSSGIRRKVAIVADRTEKASYFGKKLEPSNLGKFEPRQLYWELLENISDQMIDIEKFENLVMLL